MVPAAPFIVIPSAIDADSGEMKTLPSGSARLSAVRNVPPKRLHGGEGRLEDVGGRVPTGQVGDRTLRVPIGFGFSALSETS